MPLGSSGPPHLLGNRRARPVGSGILASSEPPPAGHHLPAILHRIDFPRTAFDCPGRWISAGNSGGPGRAANNPPPRTRRAGRPARTPPRPSCSESARNRFRRAASASAVSGRSAYAALFHPLGSSRKPLRERHSEKASLPHSPEIGALQQIMPVMAEQQDSTKVASKSVFLPPVRHGARSRVETGPRGPM